MTNRSRGFLLLGILPLAVMMMIYGVAVVWYAEATRPAAAVGGEVWPWTATVCVPGSNPSGRDDVFFSRTAEGMILRTPRLGRSTWIGGGR